MKSRGKNRGWKVDAGKISVNLPALLLAIGVTACGPSPRPIPITPGAVAVENTGVVPDSVSIAWRTDTGSGILAPLLVSNNAVLATTTNRLLVALSTATGRRYWYQRFDASVVSGAALLDDAVFIATESRRGEAHRVEYARGRKRWSRRVGAVRFAPLVDEGRAIFASDEGRLTAFDARDGSQAWQARFRGTPAMAPMLYRDRILLATTADTLYSFSRAGAELAKLPLPSTVSAEPLLSGDTLIAPLHDARVYVIALDSPRIARRYPVDGPVLAPPVKHGDAYYVVSRAGSVWELSGAPRRIATTGSAVRASFAGAGGRLVAGTLDGRVIAFDTSGAVLWQLNVGEAVSMPVTIAGSTIFVPLLEGEVLALRGSSGRRSQ